mgnify:CR=1 FL=1
MKQRLLSAWNIASTIAMIYLIYTYGSDAEFIAFLIVVTFIIFCLVMAIYTAMDFYWLNKDD